MKAKIIKSMCLVVFGVIVGWFLSLIVHSDDRVEQHQPVAAGVDSIGMDKQVTVVIDGTTNLELKLVVVSKSERGGPTLTQETVVLPYKREWDAKTLGAWIDYDNSEWELGDGFRLALIVNGDVKTEASTEKFKYAGKTGTCYVGNL